MGEKEKLMNNQTRIKKNYKGKKSLGGMLSLLLIFFLFGCASHGSSKQEYPSNANTINKGKKSPATQNPYRIKGKKYVPINNAKGFVQIGIASWYGKQFHGRKTANGEIYNMYGMTAAHKTLPMGTWVLVENLKNHKSIKVRVNDRGPFVSGRIIDLSHTGAKKLGMLGPGTATVRIRALGQATAYAAQTHSPVKFKPMDYWKGNFTVQVGAFKNQTNAQAYKKKLSKTYTNAHILIHDDYRGRFYRVRIGRFSNLSDAEKFSNSLTDKGFGQTFAVAE